MTMHRKANGQREQIWRYETIRKLVSLVTKKNKEPLSWYTSSENEAWVHDLLRPPHIYQIDSD